MCPVVSFNVGAHWYLFLSISAQLNILVTAPSLITSPRPPTYHPHQRHQTAALPTPNLANFSEHFLAIFLSKPPFKFVFAWCHFTSFDDALLRPIQLHRSLTDLTKLPTLPALPTCNLTNPIKFINSQSCLANLSNLSNPTNLPKLTTPYPSLTTNLASLANCTSLTKLTYLSSPTNITNPINSQSYQTLPTLPNLPIPNLTQPAP